jgi:hypothetical protein
MVEGSEKIYNDIEYLTNKNIWVVHLSKQAGNNKDVKITNNTKEDFKPSLKIDEDLYNIDVLKHSINNNIVGYFLQTGKRSNITIIDIDIYKETLNQDIINKSLIKIH